MLSSLLSNAQLSVFPEQQELCKEYKELSMGKQSADHWKLKSCAKIRHIYGWNAL
jgi:hypothetical protein